MSDRATITVVGLGSMGAAMARRMAADGLTVRGWNRSPVDTPTGVERVDGLADAVRGSGVVITMLSDDAAVEDVVLGLGGLLTTMEPGAVHASMSTVSPGLTTRLSELHAEAGRDFVAAPVFGRPDAAARGDLHIVPGGDLVAMARLDPVFRSLGQRAHPQDTPAQASLLKLTGNFLIAATVEALGEALALGETGGVPPDRTLDLLQGTLFDAPVLRSYGPQVASKTFRPAGFPMPLGLKDIELAREAAREGGLTLPLAELIRDHMQHSLDAGRHDDDWSAISAVAGERAEPG